MLIGAFAAGVVLHPAIERPAIERAATPIGHFFVPFFFASVGAEVNLRSFGDPRIALMAGLLIAVAVLAKIGAGYAPWWFRGNKALIGMAMIPHGEVGLIFAQMGLRTGALTRGLFSAIALMVVATTLIAPLLISRQARRDAPTSRAQGEGGIEELVT